MPFASIAARLRLNGWSGTLLPVAVALAYFALTLPILGRNHFDRSVFIQAGDKFADAAALPSPIIVRPNSTGYDGQFYYRLALSPLGLQPVSSGIRFDSPAFRMQRIVYPLLAGAVAFGRADWVPSALFLVNLVGLGAIAWLAQRLAARLRLPIWTPLAIMLWPGFFITLTHDTTEIIAAALLLAAVDRYLSGRLLAYAVLGALASLTRETGILLLGGVFCLELFQAVRPTAIARPWSRVLVCGLAMLPFLAWQEALVLLWGEAPRNAGVSQNLGWPLLGVVGMLRDVLAGAQHFAPGRTIDLGIRAYVVGSTLWLLAFCAVVATRVPSALRSAAAGVAAGWVPLLLLMSLLSAGGSWINPAGYFRAFTECYVVGCLLPMPVARRWVAWGLLAGAVVAFAGAWVLTVGEK
jgi:hypothetical protein